MLKWARISMGICLGGAVSAGSALAIEEIDLDPERPTATAPLTLILSGVDNPCNSRSFRSLEIEGSNLRVESLSWLGPCGLAPPPGPYHFIASVGLLPAGTYTVEHVSIDTTEEGETERILAMGDFTVEPGVEIAIVPELPAATDALVLSLTGSGPNPSIGVPELDSARRIRIAWDFGALQGLPILPHTLESAPIGPLPAGVYVLEVYETGETQRLLAVSDFEVLPDPETIGDGRFEIEVSWKDFEGTEGQGRLVAAPSSDSALYWFFHPDNWELMVKVLDGCAINGHFWVFAAASTDVEYTVDIRDLVEERDWTFTNPLGVNSPAVTDTAAFACQ